MNFPRQIKNPIFIFIHDIAWVPVAWLGAYWLRFNLDTIPQQFFEKAIAFLPLIILVQGIMFWVFGLYRGIWRFASMPDLMRIVKAIFTGVLITLFSIFVMTRGYGVPRSVFPLYGLILLVAISGPRFIYRWIKDHDLHSRKGQRVLIIGAGRAGEMLIRDLIRDPNHTYYPIALVDDDKRKIGKEIHRVRVRGTTSDIADLVERYDIEIILLALPSASSKQMQIIVKQVESCGIPFRTLPKMEDLMSGQISINELKEVSIEDLLGREQTKLDWDLIQGTLSGKTVLVSGGGGSIGSELCRQISKLNPKRLIIMEHSEYNIYNIEMELTNTFPDIPLEAILGDVGDKVLVEQVFRNYKPQVVFHAAAYKHVPILEHQIRSAIKNNIMATRNIAEVSDASGTEIFVLVSTDKAVNPANIMGATKRVAEIWCQSLNAVSSTKFVTVRFGNVLDSAGSVIPLFRKQIEAGGPVTVTHKEITRYFMTIPEAAQLIIEAAAIGEGGEIFVLDMGDPIKIAYLAEQLILLTGKKPGEDIEIVYSGLRPGEKLYEELFHKEEKLSGTSHPKILLAASRKMDHKALNHVFNDLEQACGQNNDNQMLEIVDDLVPEHALAKSVLDSASDNSKVATIYQLDEKRPDQK